MTRRTDYLTDGADTTVTAVIHALDRDVERGEDILMLGLGLVMMSSFFAPIAPPKILLPAIAIAFALSASVARWNYHGMERKLLASMARLGWDEQIQLQPLATVFSERPMPPLTHSFNPLKNMPRLGKSLLGGLLLNPLWMPIFYMMGMQMHEERNLLHLHTAVIGVRGKLTPHDMPIEEES